VIVGQTVILVRLDGLVNLEETELVEPLAKPVQKAHPVYLDILAILVDPEALAIKVPWDHPADLEAQATMVDPVLLANMVLTVKLAYMAKTVPIVLAHQDLHLAVCTAALVDLVQAVDLDMVVSAVVSGQEAELVQMVDLGMVVV